MAWFRHAIIVRMVFILSVCGLLNSLLGTARSTHQAAVPMPEMATKVNTLEPLPVGPLIAVVGANVNFCNMGGGVLWVTNVAEMLLAEYPTARIHLLVAKCRCLSDPDRRQRLRHLHAYHPRLVLLSPCAATTLTHDQQLLVTANGHCPGPHYTADLSMRTSTANQPGDVAASTVSSDLHALKTYYSWWQADLERFHSELRQHRHEQRVLGRRHSDFEPAILEQQDFFDYMMAMRRTAKYDLWIVRGQYGQTVSSMPQWHDAAPYATGKIWHLLSLTIGRYNTTFDKPVVSASLGIVEVLSNPFLTEEQRSQFPNGVVIIPPMIPKILVDQPRQRTGMTVCHIGALYSGASMIREVLQGFRDFKAHYAPDAKFIFKVSEIYFRSGGDSNSETETVSGITALLDQVAADPASGIHFEMRQYEHDEAMHLYSSECDIGIRTYTAVDAHTVFSTKMLEMASTGLPLLMNRLDVCEHFWGANYEFFFDDAASLTDKLRIALVGPPDVYRRASAQAIRWASQFTYSYVANTLRNELDFRSG